jgi:hypothetical protein
MTTPKAECHQPRTPKSKNMENPLSGLRALGGDHLLAILVVADTRGGSTVAAALAGTDTASSLSATLVLGRGYRGN